MTWRLIGPIWRLPDVTASQRLVLLALASFTDQSGGNAYPSQSTLARMCCCNRSTIQRALKSLLNRQLIKATGKGRKGTIRYKVNASMHQDVPHNASATSRTVQHNPSKVIPGNYPSKKDSYFNYGNQQALKIDRFSNVKLPESGGEISLRLQREREARRKR